MSSVLRPVVNADHVVLTMKLDVKWADVPVLVRMQVLEHAERAAQELEAIPRLQMKEASDAASK